MHEQMIENTASLARNLLPGETVRPQQLEVLRATSWVSSYCFKGAKTEDVSNWFRVEFNLVVRSYGVDFWARGFALFTGERAEVDTVDVTCYQDQEVTIALAAAVRQVLSSEKFELRGERSEVARIENAVSAVLTADAIGTQLKEYQ